MEFHKQGIDPKRTIEVGEIVIVHAENKRLHWRLGKVISLLPSKDGMVRAAIVKVLSKGINKANYIKRPIEKLYPLEIKSIENVDNSEINESKNANDANFESDDEYKTLPRRNAADNGILIRRLMGQV